MNIAIFGAGKMAEAIVFDFLEHTEVQHIQVIDKFKEPLQHIKSKFNSHKISTQQLDIQQTEQLEAILKQADCAIGAASYRLNLELSRQCIAHRTHFCDLGGNNTVVAAQRQLHQQAVDAGITIVPDCGLAPGMANILAYHFAEEFKDVNHLKIRVGGLPLEPQTALKYQCVFSVEGLINEYIEDVWVLDNHQQQSVMPLAGLESLSMGDQFPRLEAFYTSGGISTLTETMADKVKKLDYKTIRYPGHMQYFRFLLDAGFLTADTRQKTQELLNAYLPHQGPDVVLIRISVDGTDLSGNNSTKQYDCIDSFQATQGLSAMQRMTGFSIAIVANMLVTGTIKTPGIQPQELVIPGKTYLSALKARNIDFKSQVFSV